MVQAWRYFENTSMIQVMKPYYFSTFYQKYSIDTKANAIILLNIVNFLDLEKNIYFI